MIVVVVPLVTCLLCDTAYNTTRILLDENMTDLRGRNLNGPPSSPNGHHGFDFGNITPTREKLTPEQAPASPPPPPRSSGTADRSSTNNGPVANGVADFFSPDVFQIVLHNPATAHQLLKFSRERMCGENMEFLERVRILTSLQDGEIVLMIAGMIFTGGSLQHSSGRIDQGHLGDSSHLHNAGCAQAFEPVVKHAEAD